ncbi:MAG TPA: efflux RND transporter periplasmic adaptor subunit [Burkholderiales bacterium]|nr:efflux RND transporter periplasmic adaptor subunit [Burkholderiales bacterium]
MAGEDLSNLRIAHDSRATGAAPRGRRRVWRWLALCALIAAAAYFALHYRASVTVEAAAVSEAYPSQGYTLLNATGYVVAQRKAAVGSKATGRLEWLGVREGSQVKRGEVVARIESRDVAAQADQAAANVKVARANLEQGEAELKDADRAMKRSEELLRQKFVSQAAHDQAVARYDKARAGIASQKAAIAVAEANYRATRVGVEQTLIRAPFDGVVLTKNANVGDNITPFSAAADTKGAVVTMADMSTLEVEADVSESSLAKVKLGQPCEIQLDALPGIRFRGAVGNMVPTVDRAKATVTAKVRFVDHDPRILPEMSAKVAFLEREVPAAERTPRTAVPAAALIDRNGKTVAYRIDHDQAYATPIEKGESIGDLVEVKSGLKSGDRVVLRPPANLRDGARVSFAKK